VTTDALLSRAWTLLSSSFLCSLLAVDIKISPLPICLAAIALPTVFPSSAWLIAFTIRMEGMLRSRVTVRSIDADLEVGRASGIHCLEPRCYCAWAYWVSESCNICWASFFSCICIIKSYLLMYYSCFFRLFFEYFSIWSIFSRVSSWAKMACSWFRRASSWFWRSCSCSSSYPPLVAETIKILDDGSVWVSGRGSELKVLHPALHAGSPRKRASG